MQSHLLSNLIEPQLVTVESARALATWRDRVAKATQLDMSAGTLAVALEGLAVVGDDSDIPLLQSALNADGMAPPLRLLAAKALGKVSHSGMETTAVEQWSRHPEPLGSLLAAHLLSRHTSNDALQLFDSLLESGADPAKPLALLGIANVDLNRALAVCPSLADSEDSNVRMAVVRVLNRSPSVEHLNQQAEFLVDANSNIRGLVRENLLQKASEPELRPTVDEIITYFLQGEQWEGLEQAIRMSVKLKQHERTASLVPLIEHPRHEVRLWASWSFQELEVSSEELAAIHKFCLEMTERIDRQEAMQQEVVLSTAFLFEALGLHEYRPADEMLRRYIPKADQKMRTTTRASAIYALGKIWAKEKNAGLGQQLVRRLTDDGVEPEEDIVRYASGIAVGRIGDPQLVSQFDYLAEENLADPITRAAVWAKRMLEQR